MDRVEAAQLVRELADGLGFGLVGIARAEPSGHAEAVRRWLAAGRHGQMHYLSEHLDKRLDPGQMVPGARSVIAVADAYLSDGPSRGAVGVPRGRVARYAHGDDYHPTIKKRLHKLADTLRPHFPGHEFRSTVDTAPALEREQATRAGLGWTGKNTMLIHPRHGSYVLLGTIITTLDLQTSEEAGWPGRTVPPADHCGTCTRCVDACPTRCIDATAERGSPRSIDASRCISYLTIEHRGPIDPALYPAIGDWIAGCDVCQEVCPYNSQGAEGKRQGTPGEAASAAGPLPPHPKYAPHPHIAAGLPLLDVLGWDEDARRAAFLKSALKRIKLDQLKRNALIAAGNALATREDPDLRRRIEAIAADPAEPDLVRETAQQVLERMRRAISTDSHHGTVGYTSRE